jgi:hypothetical protein
MGAILWARFGQRGSLNQGCPDLFHTHPRRHARESGHPFSRMHRSTMDARFRGHDGNEAPMIFLAYQAVRRINQSVPSIAERAEGLRCRALKSLAALR